MVPSVLAQFCPDPGFSIVYFSPLGPPNRPRSQCNATNLPWRAHCSDHGGDKGGDKGGGGGAVEKLIDNW